MSPELSLRLLEVIPYLQNNLPLEDWWKVQDEFSSVKEFNNLSKKTQELVTTAEKEIGVEEQSVIS